MKQEKWTNLGFLISRFTKVNIQICIMSCDHHASDSGSAASAAVALVAANKNSCAQRKQMTAWEGTTENTRLCSFEKSSDWCFNLFSLSFFNSVLFWMAGVASLPSLLCVVSLLSLQELLVYQLSSNSFPADFFFLPFFLSSLFNYPLHPPRGCVFGLPIRAERFIAAVGFFH